MPIATAIVFLVLVSALVTLFMVVAFSKAETSAAVAKTKRRRVKQAEQRIADAYTILYGVKDQLLNNPIYEKSPVVPRRLLEQSVNNLERILEGRKPGRLKLPAAVSTLQKRVEVFQFRSSVRWEAQCDGCDARSDDKLSSGLAVSAVLRGHEYLNMNRSNRSKCEGTIRPNLAGSGHTLPTPNRGHASPEVSVAAVKDKIGALRVDIGWVIDHPAFFATDSTVSADLFAALGEWDDTRHNLATEEATELAARIEELFTAAKEHAEHIGQTHLYGETRAAVEKASKLAAKAASTSSEHERAALMRKAAEVLAGVMETVMPAETIRELETLAAAKQITT